MKSKFKIISLILLIILLSHLSIDVMAENYSVNLPDEIKQVINNEEIDNVKNVELSKKKFEKYLYKFKNYDEEIDKELININRNSRKPFIFTVNKAIEDVTFLFRLLKYGYAGYQYFGGDEKFNSVRGEIINDIKEKSIFSLITPAAFKEILLNNLKFIQDGHFAIDGHGFIKKYSYFKSDKFDFLRDEKGYYTWLDDEKVYLISISDGNYNDYMKLSLNDKGEVIYRLGTLSKSPEENIRKVIQLKSINSEEIKDYDLVLTRQVKNYRKKKTPYNVYRKQNIPVIEHRTANANPVNREKLEQFAAEAGQFKDEEYIIIDIRGNSGGADTYAGDWVENYTGISPGEGLLESSLVTETANKLLANTLKTVYDMEEISELEPGYQKLFKKTDTGWSDIKYHENKLIENDNLIIVLIDSGVASAGESFVKYLKQLSNVVFIGTNTSGVIYFANMGMCNLPNSKFEIYMSKTISLEPDFKFREGRGYSPDFWVNPDKALDLALEFITNYLE